MELNLTKLNSFSDKEFSQQTRIFPASPPPIETNKHLLLRCPNLDHSESRPVSKNTQTNTTQSKRGTHDDLLLLRLFGRDGRVHLLERLLGDDRLLRLRAVRRHREDARLRERRLRHLLLPRLLRERLGKEVHQRLFSHICDELASQTPRVKRMIGLFRTKENQPCVPLCESYSRRPLPLI